MCGRYSIFSESNILAKHFGVFPSTEKLAPHYNACPIQLLPIILNENNQRIVKLFKWGLVSSWAKDPSFGNKMINARAETLQQKPAFKKLLKNRRCIIPADGFFEWRKTSLGKKPMYFFLASKNPFAFAGLWDSWKGSDGKIINTFTIITTEPNSLLQNIHSRMPVILLPEKVAAWLDDSSTGEKLSELLCPYPTKLMVSYSVSKEVNSPTNNHPSLIKPIPPEEPL